MLISIIIPCYNVQDYIAECVHSAYTQTYPHIEVICIDNNSSDATREKLEQLKQQYPQLIINKESKLGAPATRNKGLALAKGEWIQFLDADDLLMPEKIEHQVGMLKENPDCSFIAGSCLKRDLTGKDTPNRPFERNPFKSLFVTQLGNTCANLWNRRYIDQIRGWDEALKSSQEADLMFRLLQQNDKVAFDQEPLTIVRERPFGQISQSNHSEKWQRFFNKRIEIVEWLQHYQPEHYKVEKAFYQDALFGILKIMAEEDFKTANRLHKQYLKEHYRPSPNQTHSTRPYVWLFNILGFRGAELFRRWQKQTKK
ncbi:MULTISPECIES: glycosyltransferase family 2 protein [unclassified Carboxylicivirga]|uniref:glycosyltransferase family 2 protein n=1 Tax=Carboxylicivirga TaxID=1628153 RepID=UPI003D35308C